MPSNAYATRKTVAKGALDFALLLANSTQVKTLVDIPVKNRSNFHTCLLVLLSLSIILQVSLLGVFFSMMLTLVVVVVAVGLVLVVIVVADVVVVAAVMGVVLVVKCS